MSTHIFDTPWKITNGLVCRFIFPFVRLNFLLKRIPFGKGWKFYGFPIIQKHWHSEMIFGSNLQLRSSASSNPLGVNHPVILCTWQTNAHLLIGNNFGMTGGSIIAAERIVIGNDVILGANSMITDTDFHPLKPSERVRHPQDANTTPIEIEDNVFIGMNCLILKGVKIGCGSVIGAGSVVTKSIPPGVIAAGNPARIIKEITPIG